MCVATSSERECSKRQLMYVKVREAVISSLSTVRMSCIGQM